MADRVRLKADGGRVETRIRVLQQHPARTKIDLWRKDGARWVRVRKLKAADEEEGRRTLVGEDSGELDGLVLDWKWTSLDPSGAGGDWRVEIDLWQGGAQADGFPRELTGSYPSGSSSTKVRYTEEIEVRA